MRRGLAIFLVVNLILLGLILNSVSTLIALLFEDCKADAIDPSEIPALNSTVDGTRPSYIPRIIHQTWQNESIPFKWQHAQKSCIDLHQDYEYKLWTDAKSREFIEKEYPWFLETFDNYPYGIMRADAIRYFILAHYGGIYLDLDDGCERRLDPLLTYKAWLRRTVPTGISNDAMGAAPQHPFFLNVIDRLQQFDIDWQVPYITVMYGTGPLFLSVVWKEYMRGAKTEDTRVRILMPDEYNNKPWSFFGIEKGSSWHRNDAKAIFWMGKHWVLVTLLGTVTGLSLYACGFIIYRRINRGNSPQGPPPSKAAKSWSWPWRRPSSKGAAYKRLPEHEV